MDKKKRVGTSYDIDRVLLLSLLRGVLVAQKQHPESKEREEEKKREAEETTALFFGRRRRIFWWALRMRDDDL